MGCVHGKCCCSRYPSSSDGDSREHHEAGHLGGGKHILTQRSLEVVPIPSHNFKLQYSVLTQRGYYPDSPDKENQDSYCIKTQIQGNPNVHFFGVFDGHGLYGAECSNFVKDRLVEILASDPMLLDDPVKAYSSAFLRTNSELHSSKIDDSMSGTTAITVVVIGDKIYVANVGDSRAVIGIKNGNSIIAEDLSSDQTPFRKDEYERVKLCGARIMSVDQVEGYKDPNIQIWDDEESQGGDPPRLWVPNGMYPGTAFTRSVGDSTAETIGVISDPEVSIVQIMPNHLFFVVASDGVFEFLSSQAVVDMVARYADPRDACAAIAGESYKLWLEHENRTDDITIIIVHIKESSNPGAAVMDVSATTEVTRNPMSSSTQNESSNFSNASGSDIYRSMRSEFSDQQHTVIRNPAIVVPSPSHQKPLDLDGG
ncbi:probable protein phosphatase 2C 35 [Mercurialis annua]|uniref:probable protein phosphatase 2C 35 n=1 Tax=Mercurialis annua TaxID=3986 RepID=UPI0021602226|nr:probable protein phosphatase 2C 35 [Mercurialis annua]